MSASTANSPTQPNLDLSAVETTWSRRFWLITVLTGVTAGLAGGALMRLLKSVEHLAWGYDAGTLLEAASHAPAFRFVLNLLGAGLLVGVGGTLIRKTLGRSGDADTAIWFLSGRMPALSTLAQGVLSIVTVGMGTSLGRESAIKQAGGVIASRLAQWFRLSRPEQRVLVACGVGAGMASAYNVPVGGALFAVEVLLGSISLRLAMPALLCSGVATASSWLLLPTEPVYQVPEYPLSMQLTVWSLAAGPLFGLAAVPLMWAIDCAEKLKPREGMPVFVAPVLVLLLLAAVAIPFPQLLGNGKDAVQVAFANEFTLTLLFVLPILKLLATSGCLACGATGGLFTPAMTIGALLGGLFGHLWDRIWPGASMGSCSVIGSCAFLAAATQGPISALVLVLELTRHVDATMVPMLLAVTEAMLVARQLESRSIYSMRIHLFDTQAKPALTPPPLNFRWPMTLDFQIVSAAAGYGQVVRQLLSLPSDANLYVVDHDGRLEGKIDASSIIRGNLGAMPAEAAKAADLAKPVQPLDSGMSDQEIAEHLASADDRELPVIDKQTGRMMGVIGNLVSRDA